MDKKGKLFGKINIIDLLVIVVAIIIVAAVGLKMTGHLGSAVGVSGSDIAYTVVVEGVKQEVYDSIQTYLQPKDQLMADGALLNGYVTGVTAAPHESSAKVSTIDGALIVPLMEDTLDLTFTIEAHVDDNTKTELGTQEVRVGKLHIVKTTHFELSNGVVTSCTWAGGTSADAA